jgi:hypothetical protein
MTAADAADSTRDAIAMVLAVRDGDAEGQNAIAANMDAGSVTIALARLLAAVLAELEVPSGHFRMWSQQEMSSP